MVVPRQLCHSSALTFLPLPGCHNRSLGKNHRVERQAGIARRDARGSPVPRHQRASTVKTDALRQILVGTGPDYRAEDATTMVVGVQGIGVGLGDGTLSGHFLKQVYAAADQYPAECHRGAAVCYAGPGHRDLARYPAERPRHQPRRRRSRSAGDNLTIRGFTARNDIFMDGIRDFRGFATPSTLSRSGLEGARGNQFGRGSTGVINQENKIPEVDQFCARKCAVRH